MKDLVEHEYKSAPAVLWHYARRSVPNVDYPGIMKKEGSRVEGILYYSINERDILMLDAF